jgi:hypothetical protein
MTSRSRRREPSASSARSAAKSSRRANSSTPTTSAAGHRRQCERDSHHRSRPARRTRRRPRPDSGRPFPPFAGTLSKPAGGTEAGCRHEQAYVRNLEDIARSLGLGAKVSGWLRRGLLVWWRRPCAMNPDGPAVVLFTPVPRDVPRAWCCHTRTSSPTRPRSRHGWSSGPLIWC